MLITTQQQIVGNNKIKAFSIIEMMVVLAVVMVLVLLAVPRFQTFVQNNQTHRTSSQLISALKYAKEEAVNRGYHVTLCAVEPGTAANDGISDISGACLTNATSWNSFIVFEDKNNNNSDNAGESTFRIFDGLPEDAITSNTSGVVQFTPTGYVNYSATGNDNKLFTIKPSGCTGKNGREIEISKNGKITERKIDCD